MISRKSTRLIAELYEKEFAVRGLYQFFYDEDYDPVFLKVISHQVFTGKQFKDFVLRIHTGEAFLYFSPQPSQTHVPEIAQRLLHRLARDILSLFARKVRPTLTPEPANPTAFAISMMAVAYSVTQGPFDIRDKLVAQLALDGYVFRNGELYHSESSVVPEEEEQRLLIILVNSFPFRQKEIIENHLTLSEEHFLARRWGDSVSNARNFLEAILAETTKLIHKQKGLNTRVPSSAIGIRDFLENHGFIGRKEKDAIDKVYGLISDTGSHPNIAQADEARLMRHLALTLSQYILLNLENYLKHP